jgi:hypothetical protein
MVTRVFQPVRHFHINRAVGVWECIKLEFYRRVGARCEDSKIRESGDMRRLARMY